MAGWLAVTTSRAITCNVSCYMDNRLCALYRIPHAQHNRYQPSATRLKDAVHTHTHTPHAHFVHAHVSSYSHIHTCTQVFKCWAHQAQASAARARTAAALVQSLRLRAAFGAWLDATQASAQENHAQERSERRAANWRGARVLRGVFEGWLVYVDRAVTLRSKVAHILMRTTTGEWPSCAWIASTCCHCVLPVVCTASTLQSSCSAAVMGSGVPALQVC